MTAPIAWCNSFTVVFPTEQQANEALFFGSQSGKDTDKLAEYGTKTDPAVKIDSVILPNALANFECVLDGELVTGDHTIFAGRVVASHLNKDPVGRLCTLASGWKMGGVVAKPSDK